MDQHISISIRAHSLAPNLSCEAAIAAIDRESFVTWLEERSYLQRRCLRAITMATEQVIFTDETDSVIPGEELELILMEETFKFQMRLKDGPVLCETSPVTYQGIAFRLGVNWPAGSLLEVAAGA